MNDGYIQSPMVGIRSILILLTTSLFLFSTNPTAAEPLAATNKVTNSVESTDELELPEPQPVKGVYATFYTLGHHGLLGRIKRLVEQTEINTVIMDVKGDRGLIPYHSAIPLATEVGAQEQIRVRDWPQFMKWFKDRCVYTIARIVVFKDNPLATTHPELAVIDQRTGQPWRDREGLAWTDPFSEEVWDYNIAIALEAATKGFDEIQFDYIRFPTDGELREALFSRPSTEKARRAAIMGFLKRARDALSPFGVKIAVDVFGYTVWGADDTGIGQNIEDIAPYVDVLSPMLYPSSFHMGIPGYPVALDHLYELVNQSTKRAVERMQGTGTVVRPWIQDFRDYAFDRRIFSPQEIRDQMEGVLDAGGKGWMLWNTRVRYTQEALKDVTVKSPGDSAGWLYFTAKVDPRCHTGSSHPGHIELRGSLFHDVVKPVFVQNRRQPLVEGMPRWGGQLRVRNPHRPLRLSLPFPDRHVTKVVPVSDVRPGRTIVPEVCPRQTHSNSLQPTPAKIPISRRRDFSLFYKMGLCFSEASLS
ncbi:putative glycoside hydrolase, partial [Acidobacteria bacterium AH-259-A15]|nr:putative glycoside hydrolase [Acidobacteria bacterium AH-259-A15]